MARKVCRKTSKKTKSSDERDTESTRDEIRVKDVSSTPEKEEDVPEAAPEREEEARALMTDTPVTKEVDVEREAGASSDDEAPEDVLWVMGKDQAFAQKRLEDAAVNRAKVSVKEKRRLKAELFKRQKEAKQLKVLPKFPEGNLDMVLERLAEKKTVQEEKVIPRMKSKKSKPAVNKVGSVQVVVAPHGDQSHSVGSKYNYESGLEFLKEELYGARLKRVPALQSQFAKKKRLGRPALNFLTPR